jgi:acetolactate synthase-1/2/3 large subunit
VELVGDVAHALKNLSARVERDGRPDFDLDYQREVRRSMAADLREHADDTSDGLLKPQKVLWEVRKALGPEDLVLSGVGAHKMWIGRYFHCHEPNTCIIPNGFCSMGLPLPGAIGAHRVLPGRKILAIAGDGDFLMNVQEMETAARLRSDIVVMVWVDGGYGLISWKQETDLGRSTPLSFGNPDWVGLAESFGWQGQYVERSADLEAALHRALGHPGPSLLALPIDYRENLALSERLGVLRWAL